MKKKSERQSWLWEKKEYLEEKDVWEKMQELYKVLSFKKKKLFS